tara:strand:+ start:128 stop:349 length:222 start_codon:yes stop_codon:yes gene_type:complete
VELMTALIEPSDPQYFTETSDELYDRHTYKVVEKSGKSIAVDNWMEVREMWWNRKVFLSHVEVIDPIQSKGFK